MDSWCDNQILALLRWFVKALEPLVLEQEVLEGLVDTQYREIQRLRGELAVYKARNLTDLN